MKIERQEEASDLAPNMTPLIDMLFILIIFFLATSRFQQAERDEAIQLVKSRSKLPIATANDLLVIDIDREGRKLIHGRERTLEEVENVVREKIETQRDAEIVVRADRRTLVTYLAETLEICHRLGIEKPKVSYESPGSE